MFDAARALFDQNLEALVDHIVKKDGGKSVVELRDKMQRKLQQGKRVYFSKEEKRFMEDMVFFSLTDLYLRISEKVAG